MPLITLVMIILTLVGGVNWTLVGFVDVNLFTIIGGGGIITTLLYLFTTISTLYLVFPTFIKQLQPA